MKKYANDIIAVLVFLLISFLYFLPSVLDGRVLMEHDAAAGIGAGQEAKEYYEENGERTRWTNTLFSGMPTYQISPSYESTDTIKFLEKVYRLFLPQYVGYIFIMMLGFYILLRCMKVDPGIACLGGIIWAFSSYFFILIAAGHLWKFITLAYIPPTIAGIILAYNKRYLLGGLLAALFASLQILSNHIQMTYYFLFVILFIVIAYFIEAYRTKTLKDFFKSTAVLAAAGILAIVINGSNLYHTYQLSKESNRGKSELVFDNKTDNSGVDKAYITQWSYGVDETLTLLIPSFKGGGSKPIAQNEQAMKKANPQFSSIYNQITEYFGDQPFTAGPVYVGAFVMFLFILGCFIVKGPIKWALLAATILSIILSWGKNFMPITDLFIDYIPLYNKFRAVSSILVIAEFTIPLLAVLGFSKLIADRKNVELYKKPLLISLVATGGIALLTAIAPSLLAGPFVSNQELMALSQLDQNVAGQLVMSLEEMRKAIVTASAWRSFVIIIIGCATLYLYYKVKINKLSTIMLVIAICLLDMWFVNQQYLNDNQFVPKSNISMILKSTEADKYILNDKDPNYRVVNFTTNTFNENTTSYFHKSIGGYNAAKLRRYQELIEHYIQPEMSQFIENINKPGNVDLLLFEKTPVLNMLNAKYFILGHIANMVIENDNVNGNAWFVSDIKTVETANEELESLGKVDLKQVAIINKDQIKGNSKIQSGAKGTITLTKYSPNELIYSVNALKTGLAVFSEIYYPGWTATIKGEKVPIIRADYVLRGIELPKGNYELKLSFHPTSLKTTETLAYIGLTILILGFIILILKYRKKQQKVN